MKPALCALGALALAGCIDAGEITDGTNGGGAIGASTHDPAEAAANEAEGSDRALATAEGTLVNGVPVGLSGARRSTQSFSIEVPAGATNLVFGLSGGTGDADL